MRSHLPLNNVLRVSIMYYVCMVTHIPRGWINRARLPILHVVSSTRKMNIYLSALAPENLVSRDGSGSPVPLQPAHLHTQAKYGAYLLRDSPRVPRRRLFIYLKPPYAIGSVGVYRVMQLRTDGVRYRECAGAGSINPKVVPNECCLRRSAWTNLYASLSYTHYW